GVCSSFHNPLQTLHTLRRLTSPNMANCTSDLHLPAFFFHGLTGDPSNAVKYEQAFAVNDRALVALSFAPGAESVAALPTQIPKAIAQIREVVASDERFQNGYVFIGHSLGGIMARSVIEEMDDHQVHTLISLAAPQSGLFYGPQPEDTIPMQVLCTMANYELQMFPTDIFDFATYQNDSNPAGLRGQAQRAFAELSVNKPELHEQFAFVNLGRFPANEVLLESNPFLPAINNVNKVDADDNQALKDAERRKQNFLKLHAAHFFGSPEDGAAAPWQTSFFGRYSYVDSLEEIETKFEDLTIVGGRDTEEFKNDTFGLKTLDERGGLFFHEVADVPHTCWITDWPLLDDPTKTCAFQDIFDKYILPALP
ncbi:hypothetical protein L915_21848, partial [Phytophthora nicotianae]